RYPEGPQGHLVLLDQGRPEGGRRRLAGRRGRRRRQPHHVAQARRSARLLPGDHHLALQVLSLRSAGPVPGRPQSGGATMPTALFTVKATITPDREEAFNEWYNHEHIPDVF